MYKEVPDISQQDRFESRNLWKNVTDALKRRDYVTATVEKSKLEDDQRHFAKVREENDLDWQPNFFRLDRDGQWVLVEKDMLIEPRQALDQHLRTLLSRHDFFFQSNKK